MKTFLTTLLLSVGVLLVASPARAGDPRAATATAAGEEAVSARVGTGALHKARFFAASNWMSSGTTSTWLTAASLPVTLSSPPQCMEISYTGVIAHGDEFPDLGNYVDFKATVNGVQAQGGVPSTSVEAAFPGTIFAMNWWKCGLAPGTYTVTVWFRPHIAGDVFQVRERTLIVKYAQ